MKDTNYIVKEHRQNADDTYARDYIQHIISDWLTKELQNDTYAGKQREPAS